LRIKAAITFGGTGDLAVGWLNLIRFDWHASDYTIDIKYNIFSSLSIICPYQFYVITRYLFLENNRKDKSMPKKKTAPAEQSNTGRKIWQILEKKKNRTPCLKHSRINHPSLRRWTDLVLAASHEL
jgi:hypothetical protein